MGLKLFLSAVAALHETSAGVLEAGCDEMTEWAELSNFQRGRLLGHGYSCNVEVMNMYHHFLLQTRKEMLHQVEKRRKIKVLRFLFSIGSVKLAKENTHVKLKFIFSDISLNVFKLF